MLRAQQKRVGIKWNDPDVVAGGSSIYMILLPNARLVVATKPGLELWQ